MKMYGIKNCQTVKKARALLDNYKLPYEFHDFKSEGITKTKISGWLKQVNWELLLNRKGLTWRGLSNATKDRINKTNAISLMVENPSIIKRPVLEIGGKVIVGYDESQYNEFL